MTIQQVQASIILITLAMFVVPGTAWSDTTEPKPEPEITAGCFVGDCLASAKAAPTPGDRTSPTGKDNSTPYRGIGKREVEPNELERKALQRFDREYAAFLKATAARNTCLRVGVAERCGQVPAPPDPYLLPWGFVNGGGGPPVIAITPDQAGAIAVARLQLPTVAPGIGPSPDLNRWKMAAVGYPLWLWADGPTHVGPVSDSVAGLNVSLEARVTSLTFRMGDGSTVHCSGDGDEWTKAVEPGTKAPTCGYTYTKPSLPNDGYTVSAVTDWAVTWTANGQSGVINVPAVQTTELSVGELQVLVR